LGFEISRHPIEARRAGANLPGYLVNEIDPPAPLAFGQEKSAPFVGVPHNNLAYLCGLDSGQPRLRPARRSITLRHLLTHTAGLVYEMFNPEMGRYMETKALPGIISCQNAALSLPLVFDPGEKWDYGIYIDSVGKAV
jgi:hypothetical protein